MTFLSSVPIWLGLSVISAFEAPPSEQPQQTFRVFADVTHSGTLNGPLSSAVPAANEFGIAAPLPSGSAGRKRWPEKLEADDPVVERLGRLRIETTPAAGDVVVSIESDSRRCLRLFRKGAGGWRRLAPGEDHSWTLAPGKLGVLEVGVGVMIPEARGAAAQAVWPRVFTVEIATKAPDSARCAYRSGWHPS